MTTLTDIERFERIMKRFSKYDICYLIALIWSISFLAGFAHAQEGQMLDYKKAVSCTTDEYQKVKNFLKTQHGELPMFRYITSIPSGVELFVNPVKGTSSILEYIPDEGLTCIISEGKDTQINSKVIMFNIEPKGTETSFLP